MPFHIDLIERGYFPREVPPPFQSTKLAAHVSVAGVVKLSSLIGKVWWTSSVRHNLARPAGLRRPLAIPNPIGYLGVANEVEAGWSQEIEPLLKSSTLSASRPILSTGPRAVEYSGNDDIELRRAASRGAARYVVHADIQNFYPSVYTHSVAWALHTKAAAKAAMGNQKLLGNRLDRALRGCQEGQTIGIAIGPDASLIVAECLLSAVEVQLTKSVGGLKGYRWIDDFELCFATMGEAERALTTLQELLSEYEFSLNPRKTRIAELPEPQEKPGVWTLRRWEFSSANRARQATDLIGYFDEVFRVLGEHRGEPLAAYAVARLRSVQCLPANWPLLQNFLLQILVTEPSCARQVVEVFAVNSAKGLPVVGAGFSAATEVISTRHAALGHGSEVAWAIWGSIANKVPLSAETVQAVSRMDDNLVALLALHASDAGLVAAPLDKSRWAALMTTDQLRRENWLLAYEAFLQGWLPSIGSVSHIASDPFFSSLLAAGVSFYDRGASALPIGSVVGISAGPARSIAN